MYSKTKISLIISIYLQIYKNKNHLLYRDHPYCTPDSTNISFSISFSGKFASHKLFEPLEKLKQSSILNDIKQRRV